MPSSPDKVNNTNIQVLSSVLGCHYRPQPLQTEERTYRLLPASPI